MKTLATGFALFALAAVSASSQTHENSLGKTPIRHVLLLSIDGMHAVDFTNCANGVAGVNNGAPFCPHLAALNQHGFNYVAASTSKPSDSFPGLMAIVTGGTPRTTGVYYDVAYDRTYAPPSLTTGNGVVSGTCTVNVLTGSRTEYEEGIDIDQTKLNGGSIGATLTDGGIDSIDPRKLPRDPGSNCNPVFPWDFVRTNTIFGVIHAAGGYTAWSDKHPSYSAVSGAGGLNLDDYFSPEINSTVVPLPGVTTPAGTSCAAIPDPSQTGSWTDSFQNIQCYDTLKVNAILNEINGKDHTGGGDTKMPALFGMNFQAVSIGQKLIEANVGKGGYTDSTGTPSAELLNEIQFVDASIGEMVRNLKDAGKFDSTMIVVTAKHGQSPIDPNSFFPIPGHSKMNGETPATLLASLLPDSESPLSATGIGATEDDVSILWLADQTKTADAVATLEANRTKAGIARILSGSTLALNYGVPGIPPYGDPRTPDIIVLPNDGVIYTGSLKKQEEHGGFAHDDTNVIMLLSNPGFTHRTIHAAVETTQVAPTILKALGLNPASLDAVRSEGTAVLPGLQLPTYF